MSLNPIGTTLIPFTIVLFLWPLSVNFFTKISTQFDWSQLVHAFLGLGDYIPGDSPNQPLRPLYKIATTGMLYIYVYILKMHFQLYLLSVHL